MTFIYSVLTFLGWALLASSTFVWGAHFIYELFQDVSFWTAMGGNLAAWVIQIIIGFVFLGAGYFKLTN